MIFSRSVQNWCQYLLTSSYICSIICKGIRTFVLSLTSELPASNLEHPFFSPPHYLCACLRPEQMIPAQRLAHGLWKKFA